ncbi:MAG: acyl-CoA thioesterase [Bacteroidales bacterium]|nr:acyl-CoA thioesterase [Bacteroidales bacterium]
MKNEEYIFENTDIVRDYECDMQGIVNNANYQHYLEHSRHMFIVDRGVSFAELHQEGIDVVVARFEIAYKTPLRPNDEYVCRLRPEKEGVRYVFHQAIFRKSDGALCVRARVDCAATVNGRLVASHPRLEALLK